MYKIRLTDSTEYNVTSAGVVGGVFGTTIMDAHSTMVEIITKLSDPELTQNIRYYVEDKIEEFEGYVNLVAVLDRRKTNEGILIRLEKE